MNIYSNIQNPIDTDEGLIRIIKAYLNTTNTNSSFYGRAVSYGEKTTKFNENEFYNFKRKIDSLELNRIRKLDKSKAKFHSIIHNNILVKSLLNLFPNIRDCIKSIQVYPSYTQYGLVQKYTNKQLLDKYKILSKCDTDFLSDEEKDILNLFDDYILNRHSFNNLAGYHVYGDDLEEYAKYDGERKFKIYINLNYNQLYKFADKYMEICRNTGIPYTFKVLSPLHDRPNRAEKICIYCDQENFYKTIDIIKAIKSANPELKPGTPPIMAGTLDGWIGIGSDPKNTSYNSMRAECIETALDNYFEGISNKEGLKMIKNNPKVINDIRNAIYDEAKKRGIANEKFCFTNFGNKDIQEEDHNYSSKDFKLDHRKLRIKGLERKNNNFRQQANPFQHQEIVFHPLKKSTFKNNSHRSKSSKKVQSPNPWHI